MRIEPPRPDAEEDNIKTLTTASEMSEPSTAEFKEAIRSREDYEDYEKNVVLKRAKIEDPSGSTGREIVDRIIEELDTLYESHTSGTSNTVIIDTDQRAFKNTVDVISERMKNQARGVPGEITMDSMINALSQTATSKGSGTRVLETMGALFSRGSKVAPFPMVLPTLGEVNRTAARAPTFRAERQPSGRPDRAGRAEDSEFLTERIQRKTQGKVMSAVVGDEAVNDYEPLLLYRLCFDRNSFVRTLENVFAISILIKEQKLWLGSNKRGLPVIGSVVNRPKYLANHLSDRDICGPDRDLDLTSVNQKSTARQQFNININYTFYEKLKELFGDEDALIIRDDYDDEREGASIGEVDTN